MGNREFGRGVVAGESRVDGTWLRCGLSSFGSCKDGAFSRTPQTVGLS